MSYIQMTLFLQHLYYLRAQHRLVVVVWIQLFHMLKFEAFFNYSETPPYGYLCNMVTSLLWTLYFGHLAKWTYLFL